MHTVIICCFAQHEWNAVKTTVISVTDPAVVTGFYATLNPNETTAVFNKGDSVELLYTVDSYPYSTVNISRSGTVLQHRTNTSQSIYKIEQARCSDNGIYVCMAKNEKYESGSVNFKHLQIFVRCKYKLHLFYVDI